MMYTDSSNLETRNTGHWSNQLNIVLFLTLGRVKKVFYLDFVSFQLLLVLKDVSDVKTYSKALELHKVTFHESFVITRGAYLSKQEHKKGLLCIITYHSVRRTRQI